MLPKIIIHNSVSLDGAFVDFEVDMGLHYAVAGSYGADAHLIGSNTVKAGADIYGSSPPEEAGDFVKPQRDSSVPYWVIPDSRGILRGMLHEMRRFEYCRDVIVLTAEETPREYMEYLAERDYDHITAGRTRVDLEQALEILNREYGVKKALADTGSILGNILLNRGLVSEISLLVHPVIVGERAKNLFDAVDRRIELIPDRCEALDGGVVRLSYRVCK